MPHRNSAREPCTVQATGVRELSPLRYRPLQYNQRAQGGGNANATASATYTSVVSINVAVVSSGLISKPISVQARATEEAPWAVSLSMMSR